MHKFLLALTLFFPLAAYSHCFDLASSRYGIHPDLLRAISKVESNGNVKATNRNSNKSRDIGHMQINSSWLPTLKRYGITEQSLFDPCTNTFVGAWVLARNFKELGYNWNAIGAYNAKSPKKRKIYAKKIAAALKTIREEKRK